MSQLGGFPEQVLGWEHNDEPTRGARPNGARRIARGIAERRMVVRNGRSKPPETSTRGLLIHRHGSGIHVATELGLWWAGR